MSLSTTPEYAANNHWLNLLQIDSTLYEGGRDSLMKRLEKNGIQTRPVWKLNHEQKPFRKCQYYKIETAKELVAKSLCLPSSYNLKNESIESIINFIANK